MKTAPFMRDIWIYGDLRNQALFDTSLNLLSGAGQIAQSMNSKRLFVVVITESVNHPSSDERISEAKSIGQAVAYGADKILVLHVDGGDNSYIQPEITAKIIADAALKREPAAFLFPLNDIMREISARAAFLCNSGMVADCQRLKYENGQIIAVCPSHGGEIMAELGFSNPLKTGFITVQPNAFKKQLVDPEGDGEKSCFVEENRVEKVRVDIGCGSNKYGSLIKRLSINRGRSEEQSLEMAEKVVAGGAGLGNIEGFRNLRKLAAALGAQIGSTRPPVLWHWTDEERLIGQTGKSIRPELLITVGTSGAVQYTAGITEAKMVVAINKDPNAPIFRFADIGIVEDAALFLPALTSKIQKMAMRALADSLAGDDGKGERGGSGELGENIEKGADFGSKLMQMRKAHQLTIEELAKRTGRTPDFIEELEKNQTTPYVGFMIKLSEVFGIDPGTFLNDDERATLSGNRAKEYTRRTGNYYYQTLTPGAENEHLRVFMVTIEANKKHKPVAYRHEGEEFIYVMEGSLELILDGKPHKLMVGESMKFSSETPHQLKSLGDDDTRCLVTLYTP